METKTGDLKPMPFEERDNNITVYNSIIVYVVFCVEFLVIILLMFVSVRVRALSIVIQLTDVNKMFRPELIR